MYGEKVEAIQVTIDLIVAARSGPGGWNADQLAILGVEWPPKKGWMQSAVGRVISVEDAEMLIALRGLRKRNKARKRMRRERKEKLGMLKRHRRA